MIVQNVVLFLVAAAAASGAGLAAFGRLSWSDAEDLALRFAGGFVLLATAFFAAAQLGALNRHIVGAIAAIGVLGFVRHRGGAAGYSPNSTGRPSLVFVAIVSLIFVGVFVLALYPPTGFDETLYHLPTVGAFAASGRMPFLPTLRTPVFPHMAEVLETALFLFGGDTATHLVSLLATSAVALLVFGAAARREVGAGPVAVAIFVSSPIVVHLAASGYVEPLLTLFVVGSLAALDRWRENGRTADLVLAGALAGGGAAVKYLGLFWIAVGFVLAACAAPRGGRRRASTTFAVAAVLVLLPWYVRIVAATGNPIFPFAPRIFGHTAWDPIVEAHPGGLGRAVVDFLRIPWDTIVARGRVNFQPPFSPWIFLALPLIAGRAITDRRARVSLALCAVWAAVWLALPRDSRYLTILVPIVSVEGGAALSRALRPSNRRAHGVIAALLALLAAAYLGLRIGRSGELPLDASAREKFLTAHVPAYRAIEFLDRDGSRDRVFVCGGENLRWYYDGAMIGDASGLARYDETLASPDSASLAARLQSLGVRKVLAVRPACTTPLFDAAPFRLLYSDDAASVFSIAAARR